MKFRILLLAAVAATGARGQLDRYKPREAPAVSFDNSARLASLVRAGNLYLSLDDAIALALENNLDIQLHRYDRPIAETDTLRAKGGGTLRGVPLSVSELPPGVGGPGSPLLNAAATGAVTGTSTVVTTVSDTFPITGGTNNLSISTGTLSTGPLPPSFDPALTGQLNWLHQSTPQANSFVTGAPSLSTRSLSGILGLQQGFSPGTTLAVNLNSMAQRSNSTRLTYNPYTTSNVGLNLVQPLFRGFGARVNRRFIRIAKNDERISDLVFRQQVISVVSGVIRLYSDLASLSEDLRVRRQTLALAQQLFENNRVEVEQGTLAPIELTRAQAFIAAARQDRANSEGYVAQQELVLKAVLSRRGSADPLLASTRILPTDPIEIPPREEVRPLQDLLADALRNRPEVEAARLQLENLNIGLEGSRSALLPEIDLVATLGLAGLAGQANALAASQLAPGTVPGVAPGNIGGLWTALGQAFRSNYPTYGAGIQVVLPLRNRVAEADYARDSVQVRQSEVRRQQVENQVRLEIENALVALNRSRAAMEAATESRGLQEKSLALERERYTVGLSTSFLIMQYQSFLAQARATEVAARSTYVKAREALERAIGATLPNHGVSIEEAWSGRVARPPNPPPVDVAPRR